MVNPFRAVSVLGTPGSGKSYAIINNFIKQQIEKGFAIYCYDFKYPDLSTIVYNHLLHHSEGYKVKPKFYVINFDDPRRSHRCNPIISDPSAIILPQSMLCCCPHQTVSQQGIVKLELLLQFVEQYPPLQA